MLKPGDEMPRGEGIWTEDYTEWKGAKVLLNRDNGKTLNGHLVSVPSAKCSSFAIRSADGTVRRWPSSQVKWVLYTGPEPEAKHWEWGTDEFADNLFGFLRPDDDSAAFDVGLDRDEWECLQAVIIYHLPEEAARYPTPEDAARCVVAATLRRAEEIAAGCRALLQALPEVAR